MVLTDCYFFFCAHSFVRTIVFNVTYLYLTYLPVNFLINNLNSIFKCHWIMIMMIISLLLYIFLSIYLWGLGGLWCLTSLSTIFQLYRGFRFIGGGNRSTRRKPPTYRKSLTTFSNNVVSSTPDHEWDLNSGHRQWLHR